jgi:hypothetical protein
MLWELNWCLLGMRQPTRNCRESHSGTQGLANCNISTSLQLLLFDHGLISPAEYDEKAHVQVSEAMLRWRLE